VRSLQSFVVGCASIIRPAGRRWADRHRGGRPLSWRAMDEAFYGSSTFERSVPL